MERILRLATVEDVLDVCSIDYELFPENNFNERTLHNQIATGTGWVVYEGRKLLAYLLANGALEPVFDILRLGVREPWRQQGVATQLLQTAIEFADHLMLTVQKSNTPAIQLYRKYGFEITGIMPQHYSWVMELKKTSS